MCVIIKRFLSIIFKIINIALLLCGIAIVILGVLLLVKGSIFLGKHLDGPFMASPIVFIVVGATIFGISFLGCCGFRRQSMICLIPYAACLVVVIVALVIVCILLSAFLTKKELRENLSKSFNQYKTSQADKKFWDELQTDVKCCGLDGPADWTDGVPESCCGDKKSKDSKEATECRSKSRSKPYLYQRGCVDSVYDIVTKHWNIILYTALIMMAVSVLALIVALIIICDVMCPGGGSSKRN